jgi:hypothetical protein
MDNKINANEQINVGAIVNKTFGLQGTPVVNRDANTNHCVSQLLAVRLAPSPTYRFVNCIANA